MRIVATVASVSRLSRLRRTSENSVNRKFNFAEFYKGEVRRIPIPRTSVNKGINKGRMPPLEAPLLPYGSTTSQSQLPYPLHAVWGCTPLEQVPLEILA